MRGVPSTPDLNPTHADGRLRGLSTSLRPHGTQVVTLLACWGCKTIKQVIDEFPELEPEDVLECLRYAAWLASGRNVLVPPAA